MREEIGRLQSRIATDGLRLVRPELVHVTIKFLGDVPQEKVGQVAEALGKVKVAPFPVRVLGMGAFPGRAVRVVWLGLEGNFQELYEKVEQALSPLGFAPEARGFSPHVTLGRVARPSAGDESPAWRKNRKLLVPGPGQLHCGPILSQEEHTHTGRANLRRPGRIPSLKSKKRCSDGSGPVYPTRSELWRPLPPLSPA